MYKPSCSSLRFIQRHTPRAAYSGVSIGLNPLAWDQSQIYIFALRVYQDAGKRPRQWSEPEDHCPWNGSRSRRDRGRAVGEPLGESKFSDLPAYTICLWHFSPKSQFSGAYLTNLPSFKWDQNFVGYCHWYDKGRVKKWAQTGLYFLSYSDLNFRKNRVFLLKRGTTTTTTTTTTRTHFLQKKSPKLEFVFFTG